MSFSQSSPVGTLGRAWFIIWDDSPAEDLEGFEVFGQLLETAFGYDVSTVRLTPASTGDFFQQAISDVEHDANMPNPLIVYYSGGYLTESGTPFLTSYV